MALRGRHAPALGCGLHEHRARRRSGLAQRLHERAHAGAAAGALQVERRVLVCLAHRRHLDPDLVPVALQLLGQDHRQRSVYALTHLRLGQHEGHRVIGGDSDPGVEHRGRGPARHAAPHRWHMKAKRKPGGRPARDLEETAPAELDVRGHGSPPLTPERRGESPCAPGHRCRSGRGWSLPCRCRRRSAAGCPRAAQPRP